MEKRTIYFDNAATTFPKPQSVTNAVIECMENYCGNAGRGSHPLAMRSAETVFAARESVAALFGAESENVVFTLNTTYALNMAIKGIMSGGGHMLISNMEHNSTLRPVEKLKRERRIRYDVFKAYDGGILSPKAITDDIISKLRPDTKLVCAVHSSNICSATLPIREIGALCRRHGLLFIVDAAQSAGHLPIDMKKDNIDILCLPAHKGLYSPQGCGIMILREGLKTDTLIEGGNGVSSLDATMGAISPERYESGTLCTPAIAGLCAGVDFIRGLGLSTFALHEHKLWRLTYSALSDIDRVNIYDGEAGGVLLFGIEGLSPDRVGELLSKKGFCLRTGYHCSALAHKALGTQGGGVRASFGIFNTEAEVEMLCEEIKRIAATELE
jgi:cysteine desulfurase family protein